MPIPTSRSRRRGAALRVALAGALTTTAVAALGPSPAAAAPNTPTITGAGVVDIPVRFTVMNRNTTGIPCQTEPDGKTYTVHANLVAPGDLVRASSPAVTMYLHGLGYSSFFFHLTEVPEYDYARNQATQGHVSLVIDRLGNPAHDELPDGLATCLPAQADMADQIADALRAGNYKAGDVVPRFGRVILAGHSAGGLIAELTQAIYASAEALAVIGYTHYPSPLALQTLAAAGQDCLTAPQPARGDTGAPNYAPFGRTDAEFAAGHFHDVEPAVAELVLRKRNRDACGDLLSTTQGYLATHAMTPAITVPTLLILGTKDAFFPPPGPELQVQTAYPQAPRLSFVQLEGTGHAITLGRTAEKFRSIVAQWLAENQA